MSWVYDLCWQLSVTSLCLSLTEDTVAVADSSPGSSYSQSCRLWLKHSVCKGLFVRPEFNNFETFSRDTQNYLPEPLRGIADLQGGDARDKGRQEQKLKLKEWIILITMQMYVGWKDTLHKVTSCWLFSNRLDIKYYGFVRSWGVLLQLLKTANSAKIRPSHTWRYVNESTQLCSNKALLINICSPHLASGLCWSLHEVSQSIRSFVHPWTFLKLRRSWRGTKLSHSLSCLSYPHTLDPSHFIKNDARAHTCTHTSIKHTLCPSCASSSTIFAIVMCPWHFWAIWNMGGRIPTEQCSILPCVSRTVPSPLATKLSCRSWLYVWFLCRLTTSGSIVTNLLG